MNSNHPSLHPTHTQPIVYTGRLDSSSEMIDIAPCPFPLVGTYVADPPIYSFAETNMYLTFLKIDYRGHYSFVDNNGQDTDETYWNNLKDQKFRLLPFGRITLKNTFAPGYYVFQPMSLLQNVDRTELASNSKFAKEKHAEKLAARENAQAEIGFWNEPRTMPTFIQQQQDLDFQQNPHVQERNPENFENQEYHENQGYQEWKNPNGGTDGHLSRDNTDFEQENRLHDDAAKSGDQVTDEQPKQNKQNLQDVICQQNLHVQEQNPENYANQEYHENQEYQEWKNPNGGTDGHLSRDNTDFEQENRLHDDAAKSGDQVTDGQEEPTASNVSFQWSEGVRNGGSPLSVNVYDNSLAQNIEDGRILAPIPQNVDPESLNSPRIRAKTRTSPGGSFHSEIPDPATLTRADRAMQFISHRKTQLTASKNVLMEFYHVWKKRINLHDKHAIDLAIKMGEVQSQMAEEVFEGLDQNVFSIISENNYRFNLAIGMFEQLIND